MKWTVATWIAQLDEARAQQHSFFGQPEQSSLPPLHTMPVFTKLSLGKRRAGRQY